MNIITDFNLKPFHTFATDTYAKAFAEINHIDELIRLKQLKAEYGNLFILGSGSNVLFTKKFEGIVLHNRLKGIKVLDENENDIILKAASGEIWHHFVLYTLSQNYGGAENLSLIPGTVGAVPIQNIGAYGVEAKDFIENVYVHEIETQKNFVLTNHECGFGYRNSFFKKPENTGKYFITAVSFKLSKHDHIYHTSYGSIRKILEEEYGSKSTIQNISAAVVKIRKDKLPDPKAIGNAGSFFKNPEISKKEFEPLLKNYPNIPHFYTESDKIKIPAAWLIEQCGWKGSRVGQTGNHITQPLVIVNYGHATGAEIKQHAFNVQTSVKEKFNIHLEAEVNII